MTHRKTARKRIPKDSRTIPMKGHKDRGEGEDHGRWFRCWNCGFPCSKDREALSGPEGEDGIVHEDFFLPAYGIYDRSDESTTVTATRGNGEQILLALLLGGDGEPTDIVHNIMPDTASGCPLCGCLNWRGDY